MENEKVIVDTLKKFGNEFQEKSIACLLSNKPFLERILDILKPEYFESNANQWIVQEIVKYFIEYKDLPTLVVFKVKIDQLQDDVLKKSIINQLKSVYQNVTAKDIKYVEETFLEFCKNQSLKNAMLTGVEYLKTGEYEKIRMEIDKALKAGAERNLGTKFTEDVDKWLSENSRICVRTGWPLIDGLMDGGLGEGELGIIMAPSGVGKSWILTRIGTEALKQGKNVLHFTLELNESYINRRYASCLTGTDFQIIPKRKDIIKKQVTDIKNKVGFGKLCVKYFPIKTASPLTLKSHLERCQMIDGIKYNLIIVDYADILRPITSDRNANSYSDAGSIYEDLRMISGELKIPCWSASQCNRCLSLETLVTDEVNGKVEVKNIKVGDKILTQNGYKSVKNVFPVKTQPVYKIKLKSGKEIECSINHRFPTQNGQLKSIETGLSVGDKLFTKKSLV